ncbi:IS110 family transposase [Caldisericum exile]|uniref:Transposase n=1 Tax=Caldisericum exile (strain DSM 21853 / NBRC 104410 / AZM16c01) TaxID=511051 RepID=A0A7U6JDY6_CALEA|nr:IS110 family transposase [Caldisericum exile]BAL80166.1 putative transposase [Caldisericum exile AZM16c01]BAL80180.1 putative transposase [Caldisericum exile AZM16c01]BAL80636.1 putative transposase for insertion sequence element [Caldisericum exile AZM16c01]
MESILAIGIDVSKEKLDVSFFDGKKRKSRVFSNKDEGIEDLIKEIEKRIKKEFELEKKLEETKKGTKKSKKKNDTNTNTNSITNSTTNSIANTTTTDNTPTITEVHILFESTGSYHARLALQLLKWKRGIGEHKANEDRLYNIPIFIYVINPLVIRKYTEESLDRASTDKIASETICQYVYEAVSSNRSNISSRQYETLRSFLLDSSYEDKLEIKILIKTLEGLKRTRTRILNEIEALEQYPDSYAHDAIESLKRVLIELEKEIKEIEKKIDNVIKNKEKYRELFIRLTGIPGIGKRTASAIIAYFGTFDSFNDAKEVSSYVGLTPSIKESGKSVKRASYNISKMGNPYLRQLLYMASLSASRYNTQCKLLYNRLLTKGKEKKLIHIAVANKLIRQAFSIVKLNKSYDPIYGLDEDMGKEILKEHERIKEKKALMKILKQQKEKKEKINTTINNIPIPLDNTLNHYPNIAEY